MVFFHTLEQQVKSNQLLYFFRKQSGVFEDARALFAEIYRIVKSGMPKDGARNFSDAYPLTLDAYQELLLQGEEAHWKVLTFAVSSISDYKVSDTTMSRIKFIVAADLMGKVPLYNQDHWRLLGEVLRYFNPSYLPNLVKIFLTRVEQQAIRPNPDFKIVLKKLLDMIASHALPVSESRPLRKRFEDLLHEYGEKGISEKLFGKNPLTAMLNDRLAALNEADQKAFADFFTRCLSQENKNQPTQKWLNETHSALSTIKPELAASILADFFRGVTAFIVERQGQGLQAFRFERSAGVPGWVSPLCWYAGCFLSDMPGIKDALNELADQGYKKVPGVGPLAIKTANACLHGFALMPGNKGIMAILRQQKRASNRTIKNAIDKILADLSDKNGVSTGQLREMSMPDFGLDAQGHCSFDFGEVEALLAIDERGSVELSWRRKIDGKELKSVPSAMKKDFAPDLKSLQKRQKELKDALGGFTGSLENAWLEKRAWKYRDFFQTYFQHPVMKAIAGRLIWRFEKDNRSCEGMYIDGKWTNPQGDAFDWLNDEPTVRLWHPIDSPPAQVLEWRNWLISRQMIQPFKQAFREIYVVTPPEIRTETYSNRFAAHILRQHQFAALCGVRDWHYRLQGEFYSENTPYRDAPAWQYRIEFWVDTADYTEDVTSAGIYQYVYTDQVRFYHRGKQVNTRDVPPLLFSELMRDVDLFVGVCSIGNDPNWQDTGNDRMHAYWRDYAFSNELSASGEVRMETLKRLVPRLKIGDKCRFEGKFLIVKGSKREYKIHCGSGNILMSPNDQYLCIVPDQHASAGKSKIYLPFEGDTLLSIIISKAMMLAEDDKITDLTILRQINSDERYFI